MKRINVLVTGVGGGGHGEQILKALRLAKTNYKIVGTDMSPISKGLMDVDQAYLVPPASAPEYIPVILAICMKHNVRALFHGSEPELKIISKERDRIQELGIFLPINPDRVIDICMDKFQTMTFLRENGFYCPQTVRITNMKEVERIEFFPTVLKPSVGGGGSANTFLAQNLKELRLFSKYLFSIYPEFIIQEYVGSPNSEYTVGVLVSMDGVLLNSIAVKRNIFSSLSNRIKIRNRTGNTKVGPVLALSTGISQGEIGRFPEVTKPCEEIAMKLGCQGAVNIQCRIVDNKVYVFEINPRFSGTTSLRAMVGYNEPDILIKKHLFDEHIEPHFSYNSGYIMRGLQETFFNHIDFKRAVELI